MGAASSDLVSPFSPLLDDSIYFLFFIFCFSVLRSWHVEAPRLGVDSELQLPAYAAAMQDPSRVCNLHHSPQQCWILNPLSEARGQT